MVSASVSVRKHWEGTVVDASLIYSVRFCMPEGKRHKEDNFTTGLRYDAKFICSLKLSVAPLLGSVYGVLFYLFWSKLHFPLTWLCIFFSRSLVVVERTTWIYFDMSFREHSLQNSTLCIMRHGLLFGGVRMTAEKALHDGSPICFNMLHGYGGDTRRIPSPPVWDMMPNHLQL
jgi:hypothetical protein